MAAYAVVLLFLITSITSCSSPKLDNSPSLNPVTFSVIGHVDERYQSYNVEMAEVIGAKFWKPYDSLNRESSTTAITNWQIGENSLLFESRPPINLSSPRLRKLAAALGPAYVRVSGTWANKVYFQDSDKLLAKAPKGFDGVLTRAQWAGVLDFSSAVNAKLMTSFAISSGVRDRKGVWTPVQAHKLLTSTKLLHGSIAAAELFNEPSFASIGGAPAGYDAKNFALDSQAFRSFIKKEAPEILIAGPGSVSEGGVNVAPKNLPLLHSEDLLSTEPRPIFDIFSYHFYGAASQRCASMGKEVTTTPELALTEEWLSRTDKVADFYIQLRNKFAPSKPLWVTETADAACGGNPWASTFLDSFRYLDQLGRLAKRNIAVVFHNTLASSEYGLLDQRTFLPRPNYWAAFLWHKLMGATVLDAHSSQPGLHVYAHCLPDSSGGVALLAMNTNKTQIEYLRLGLKAERYTLSAEKLLDARIFLNGQELKLSPNDDLPILKSEALPPGQFELSPLTISFFVFRDAQNKACQ